MGNGKVALVVAALLPELGAPEPLHVNALEPGAAVIAQTLSGRERDILHLIAQGLVDREIAQTLSISPATVKSHVGNIFTKLNVQKRAHAVSRAQRLGLIDIS
jgi:LuxR family maltose regulon positive regulatory protein